MEGFGAVRHEVIDGFVAAAVGGVVIANAPTFRQLAFEPAGKFAFLNDDDAEAFKEAAEIIVLCSPAEFAELEVVVAGFESAGVKRQDDVVLVSLAAGDGIIDGHDIGALFDTGCRRQRVHCVDVGGIEAVIEADNVAAAIANEAAQAQTQDNGQNADDAGFFRHDNMPPLKD